MTSDEAIGIVIDALVGLGIPFMVVGSLAANVHGIPRATHDADFVVERAGWPWAPDARQRGDWRESSASQRA